MYNYIINESAITSPVSISKRNVDTIEFITVLQEANRPNRNGRVYKKEILEQALNTPYVQERLRTKSWYSEAGHPSDASVQRQMTIDQRNIACIIKEFWWEGDLLKGRVETANTAIGRDMKGLIEQGSRVAFSLRAQGNVHKDPVTGLTVVEAPIQICTYDWVVNPSHEKAFMESICEHAFNCLTYGTRFGNRQLALCEAANLFENGEIITLNEVEEHKMIDYKQFKFKKYKTLDEMYIYNKSDKITSINEDTVILESSNNTTKKVVLEDYIVKDIRYKIKNL